MPVPDDTPAWWLPARWPAPACVRAGITTREGGAGSLPFAGFNLGLHVGDAAATVAANRHALRRELLLPVEPRWLEQVHGARIVDAADPGTDCRADGSHTRAPGAVCVVMAADCVPLLLCDVTGTRVAAIHAGWRGIAAGIVGAGLAAMGGGRADLLAWIGPCIGARHYEVGAEVRAACLAMDGGAAACFDESRPGHWRADLPALVRRQLELGGVRRISGGDLCVYSDRERFYSHRRDGRTGRMAALIWVEPCH